MSAMNKYYQADIDKILGCDIDWEMLCNKKILITGASGMIGTVLVDALMTYNERNNANIEVCGLSRNISKLQVRFGHWHDNNLLTFLEQDISAGLDTKGVAFDYIIHAASNTHPKEYSGDPVGTITTNVFGTYHLLEYAKKHRNCRVVLLSTVEVYGENRGDVDTFAEDYCGYINCNTVRAGYPESKRVSEALLQAYGAQYDVDSVSVRLCRVYGPTLEKDDSKALTQFIHKAVNGEDIVLKSEGKQFFSYIYVADAVTSILKVMLNGERGEAYNVADAASDITLKELAEHLAKIAGKKVVFELPDEAERKGYSTATKAILNPEKIRALGWKPMYTIFEGLENTIKILRDEKNG